MNNQKYILLIIAVLFLRGITAFGNSHFSAETLKAAVENHIAEKVEFNHKIVFITAISSVDIEGDDVYAEIRENQLDKGRNTIFVDFYSNDFRIKSLEVPINIRKYGLAPVAKGNIQAKHELTNSDITIEKVELTNINEEFVYNASLLIGRTTNRFIKNGDLISGEYLEKEILVKRGDDVTVSVVSGAVTIRTSATSLQDGAEGETIRLRREKSSRSILQGVVQSDGTVLIGNSVNVGMK